MAEVTTTRTELPEFLEAAAKPYLTELQTAVGGLKGADLSKVYGPQFVAGPDALTTQAEGLASGLGGFQPYLQQAAALRGPTAYQQYMSPYQQDVIDTTLAEFDVQAAKGLPALKSAAIQAGAFGGGREGVAQAEYQATSDRNRAALQATLQQQGYQQAQAAQQQDYLRNVQLAQQTPTLLGQQIAGLTALGSQAEARDQANLEAQRQLAYQQAYQPLQATQTLGQGVMGLISGYPAQTQQTITPSKSFINCIRNSFNISWNL